MRPNLGATIANSERFDPVLPNLAGVPTSRGWRLPKVGTNAFQSWDHGFPALGPSDSQTLETNVAWSWNRRFPVLGTSGFQTLEPMFSNLEPLVPNLRTCLVSQRFQWKCSPILKPRALILKICWHKDSSLHSSLRSTLPLHPPQQPPPACTAPLRPLPDFATEVPTPPPVTFHTSTGSTRAVQAAVQAAADSAVVKSGKAQATGERGGLAELLCRVLCRLLSKVLCRGLAVESALQRCCTGLSAV